MQLWKLYQRPMPSYCRRTSSANYPSLLWRVSLDQGCEGSSPALSSGEGTFGLGQGKVQEQVFLWLQWQGNTLEKIVRRSEELGWLRAPQQPFTSWERAALKKAIFQGTLNYPKRLQQPPSVRQGREGKMQILIRWNQDVYITLSMAFCPSLCPQGASLFDVLSGLYI